jgi:uncharacterized damage-inducible protein DinB
MSFASEILKELRQEAAVTRRFLANVPFDKADYQPIEKSEKLGRLAIHVAEIVAWWKACIDRPDLDFIDFEPEDITNTQDLLTYFDKLLLEAEQALSGVTEDALDASWSMRHGEAVYFTLPKRQVLRVFCMNHLIHHRAQLGMYLRLVGAPVPATYGPSADDEDVLLVEPF